MHSLDLTLASPAENLALDEALLLDAEEGTGAGVLRFWMSPVPFVVVSVGARVREEVFWEACLEQGVPVLRRCSGGGTVLQGPGCLSYALVLPIEPKSPTASITATNRFVMKQNGRALSSVLGRPVAMEGHTDLTVDGCKVSGNSQRRMRNHLLFHGTFLLDLDPRLMTRVLCPPPRQPGYRASRPHSSFVANLKIEAQRVKQALLTTWQAGGTLPDAARQRLSGRMHRLVTERYGREEWNLRS